MKNTQAGFTIIELMIATVIFTVILTITTAAIIGISDTYVKGSVQGQTQQSARTILSDVSQDIEFNNISSVSLSTNNDNDNLVTAVSQSSSDPKVYYFCIGDDVYLYQLDMYLSTQSGPQYSNWGLIRYTADSCPTPSTVPTSPPANTDYEELLSTNERLGMLNLEEVQLNNGQTLVNGNEAFRISIEVAYGQNDLLNDVDCNDFSSPNNPAANPPTGCDNAQTNYNDGKPQPFTQDFVNESAAAPVGYEYYYQCQSGSDSSFCDVSSLTTTVAPRINE